MLLCKDNAMKLLRLMFILTTLLPLSACALSGGPVVGQVVEEGTHKPIPGAIVVVRWIGRTTSGSWFVEARDVCYHVETAVTDESGQYKTAAWTQEQSKDYTLKYHSLSVNAYKPGYGWPSQPSQTREIVQLAPFKGSVHEQFQYFSSVISNTNCGGSGESGKKLYWLWMALHEEARSLAVTAEQKKRADRLRSHAQSTIVDETKPKKYDEHGNVVNIDPRDNFKVEPLR